MLNSLIFGVMFGLQGMQPEKISSQVLREIFVTDGQIKGFLKKECKLDISEKWQNFLEVNGYVDYATNEQRNMEFFKNKKLDPQFVLFLNSLSAEIKKAFKEIRGEFYAYKAGIKCKFLRLFDWFSLNEEKKITLKCYNLIERCKKKLPKSSELPQKFYSIPASLLDRHPLDISKEKKQYTSTINYQLLLYGIACSTSRGSRYEDVLEMGNSFISTVEKLVLFHFSPASFKRRLKKGDVSYLSEPLCGFILKSYDTFWYDAPRWCNSPLSITRVKKSVDETTDILKKLFEDYQVKDSNTLKGIGLLALMVSGQVTAPNAHKIAQARHKYVFREQENAKDKVILNTFDVPLCESSDQMYSCRGDLSARDDFGSRLLDVVCVCKPKEKPLLMIGDGKETCPVDQSLKLLDEPIHFFVPNEDGGNMYQQDDTMCFVEQRGAKPLTIDIKNQNKHDYDLPHACFGSLNSNNKLSMKCSEKPYVEEVVEKDNLLLDQDYFERPHEDMGEYQKHLADVTRLDVAPDRISVCFTGNKCTEPDRGYTLYDCKNNEHCFNQAKACVKNDCSSEAWTVFVKEGSPYNFNYQDIILQYGQGKDVLITKENGPIIVRNSQRAYNFLNTYGNCTYNQNNTDYDNLEYLVRIGNNSDFVQLIDNK